MTTALIVLDVQESFRTRPVWVDISNPDIAGSVMRLVEHARELGHPVIWVWHTEPGTGNVFDPESGFVRPIAGLDIAPGEAQIVKTTRNAFTSTNLQQQLVAGGVTDLVIAGIQTEQCCETTTRIGADLGYRVTFVTEATATFPITRPDTGAVLGTDAIIERTEFALAGRFARIATIDEAFDAPSDAAPEEAQDGDRIGQSEPVMERVR